MLLYIIFILSYNTATKVRFKVDRAGTPLSLPRLRSQLAYIWTTLNISASAPRDARTCGAAHTNRGGCRERAAAAACQITTAVTTDFTASTHKSPRWNYSNVFI